MQEAALAAMHSELSAQEATRGHHGGLGFDRAVGSQSDKASNTQAGKMLLNTGGGNSSKREYHATTAGAVAAGHWDPFARPVEFKMKEVNRRIGGLYSMFVKGGTEGNTIGATTAPAASADAPAAAASASNGESFNWKRAIKSALRDAPQRQLKLKKLRKAVLAEHAKSEGKVDKEEAKRLFKSRLKKADYAVKEGKIVRLQG